MFEQYSHVILAPFYNNQSFRTNCRVNTARLSQTSAFKDILNENIFKCIVTTFSTITMETIKLTFNIHSFLNALHCLKATFEHNRVGILMVSHGTAHPLEHV